MTRRLSAMAFDLAVAAISLGLFAAAVISVADRSMDSFRAFFLMDGAAIAFIFSVMCFFYDREPEPVSILSHPSEAARTDRFTLLDAIRGIVPQRT